MELGFDVGDIAKTLGGFFAFALVLYVGVMFYKKESSFSDEYVLLLKQYKDRNEALQKEQDDEKKEHLAEITKLRKDHEKLIGDLSSKIAEQDRELRYLRNLIGPTSGKT